MQYREQNLLVVAPAAPGVSGLQPYQMKVDRFRQEVVIIRVVPQMVDGMLCTACADEEAEQAFERYTRTIMSMAPAGEPDPYAYARAGMQRLLREEMVSSDTFASSPAGYPPLLIVKVTAMDRERITLDNAVDLVHLEAVESALRQRLAVPESVLAEYQLRAPAAREIH